MFITVTISVTAFAIYNVAISMGSMSNDVFPVAIKEIPIEFIFAFSLEVAFVYKAALRLAFQFVDPKKDRPELIILAITSMNVAIMCPAMSLIAAAIHNGINVNIISNWFQKMVFNFPFAFFTQIFFIGPLVRFIFRTIFRNNVIELEVKA